MEENKPEEQGKKWTYKVEEGDNSLIRTDGHFNYQYYGMAEGDWVDGGMVVADQYEGFSNHSSEDYEPIDEKRVPEVIAKINARWQKFLDAQGKQTDDGTPSQDIESSKK